MILIIHHLLKYIYWYGLIKGENKNNRWITKQCLIINMKKYKKL